MWKQLEARLPWAAAGRGRRSSLFLQAFAVAEFWWCRWLLLQGSCEGEVPPELSQEELAFQAHSGLVIVHS